MTTEAIVMLIVAVVTVFGGLALSLVHLMKNPDETSGELGVEDPNELA